MSNSNSTLPDASIATGVVQASHEFTDMSLQLIGALDVAATMASVTPGSTLASTAALRSASMAIADASYDAVDDAIQVLDAEILNFAAQAGLNLARPGSAGNATAHDDDDSVASGSSGGSSEFEPVYCTCKQPAFGEMIACDNPTCAIEWYHCVCVAVDPSTVGETWYCPLCSS